MGDCRQTSRALVTVKEGSLVPERLRGVATPTGYRHLYWLDTQGGYERNNRGVDREPDNYLLGTRHDL